MLRHPAINGNAIAFEYGGDLWVTTRAGGAARRLTATPDVETDPHFSPDGSLIAFSRTSDGNTDVYVVSAAGGEPRRLTFHPRKRPRPRMDAATASASSSRRDRASVPQSSYLRLFTVPADGGFEEALPMPRAFTGTYSPDGRARRLSKKSRTAFIPDWYETSMWRHYRGGRTHPIRIIDLGDVLRRKAAVEEQQRQRSDVDRQHRVLPLRSQLHANLFSYNLATKTARSSSRITTTSTS